MENRKRNTALVLFAAGIYLVLGYTVGFLTTSALVVIWLGVYKLKQGDDNKKGYIFLIIGALMIIGDHFMLFMAIVLISLGIFYLRSKRMREGGNHDQRQNILESIRWNKEPWILKNMSLWNIIGEIHIDLSLAINEEKDTTIIIQGFVGDVNLIVPDDLGVEVKASVLFGQVEMEQERDAGMLNKVHWRSSNYDEAEYRVTVLISYIVGDVDLKAL